jgi:glucosamine-6-phosphate deaminase
MSFRLDVLPPERWADAVAADLAERLREEPELRLCLPTGSTPAPLYAALVRSTEPSLWSAATIVLLDEYLGLPPGDPARGGDRLRRELVDHVKPARFVAIDADAADPEAAARAHDAVAAEGLDLTLLGLGLNGHIGLDEPGSPADCETRVVTLTPRSQEVAAGYGAGATPQRGITLGIARLLESREIWLLVTGERKADILESALRGPEGPDVPASFLRRHPNLRVVADEPAARLVRELAAS